MGKPRSRAGRACCPADGNPGRAVRGRPMLVLVDDAHLLDGLSAALVHQLSTSGAAAVLLTMRAWEQPRSDVVSLYKDGALPRLDLEPLGQQDFATLASAALGGDVEPGTLHRLWRDTAGNVLFLRELVADAVEAGTLVRLDGVWRWTPDGRVGPRLAELVADRMGRLEGDRRLLAELLAVGEPLGADLVQALVPAIDLADEERRGTIVAEESGRRAEVRLAHPLFGEVLRARMPVLQRRRLQRLLADALEAAGSRRRGDVLRLATWRVESASPVDAGLLLRAARQAREVFDFALAARLARASRELAPSFEAGLLLGASLSQLGQFDAAGRVLNRLAGTEPDGTPHQLLVRERAWVMFHGPGGLAEARRVLRRPRRPWMTRCGGYWHVPTWPGSSLSGRFTEALAIGGPLIAPDMDVRVRLRSLSPVGACMVFAGRAGRVLALCDELDAAAARLPEELPERSRLGVGGADQRAAPGRPARRGHHGPGRAARTRRGSDRGRWRPRPCTHQAGPGALATGPACQRPVPAHRGRCRAARQRFGWMPGVVPVPGRRSPRAARAPGGAGRLADVAMMRRPSGLAVFDGDAARARAWVTAAAGERSRAIGQLVTAADDQESLRQPAYAMFALHDALRLGAKHVAGRLETLAASLDGPWPAAAVIQPARQTRPTLRPWRPRPTPLPPSARASWRLRLPVRHRGAGQRRVIPLAPPPHTPRPPACPPARPAMRSGSSRRIPEDAWPRYADPAGAGSRRACVPGPVQCLYRRAAGRLRPHGREPPLLRVRQARRAGSRCTRRRSRISVTENTAVRERSVGRY